MAMTTSPLPSSTKREGVYGHNHLSPFPKIKTRASKKKAVYDHDHYPPVFHKKGRKSGEVLDNDPNQRAHKPFKASDGMRCINELCLPFFPNEGEGVWRLCMATTTTLAPST